MANNKAPGTIETKLLCDSVLEGPGYETVNFKAAKDSPGDNAGAIISFRVHTPLMLGKFKPGVCYEVDFKPVNQ